MNENEESEQKHEDKRRGNGNDWERKVCCERVKVNERAVEWIFDSLNGICGVEVGVI
jgi:hypothetical protein